MRSWDGFTMLSRLKSGDAVAIVPVPEAPASEALEIVKVGRIGTGYIQLTDGRMFFSSDGRCMGRAAGWAIPVDERRDAVLVGS